jgi:hypothetical protein
MDILDKSPKTDINFNVETFFKIEKQKFSFLAINKLLQSAIKFLIKKNNSIVISRANFRLQAHRIKELKNKMPLDFFEKKEITSYNCFLAARSTFAIAYFDSIALLKSTVCFYNVLEFANRKNKSLPNYDFMKDKFIKLLIYSSTLKFSIEKNLYKEIQQACKVASMLNLPKRISFPKQDSMENLKQSEITLRLLKLKNFVVKDTSKEYKTSLVDKSYKKITVMILPSKTKDEVFFFKLDETTVCISELKYLIHLKIQFLIKENQKIILSLSNFRLQSRRIKKSKKLESFLQIKSSWKEKEAIKFNKMLIFRKNFEKILSASIDLFSFTTNICSSIEQAIKENDLEADIDFISSEQEFLKLQACLLSLKDNIIKNLKLETTQASLVKSRLKRRDPIII